MEYSSSDLLNSISIACLSRNFEKLLRRRDANELLYMSDFKSSHETMKFRVILDVLGSLLVLLGLLVLIPAIVAAIFKEPTGVMALGLTSLITTSSGIIMKRFGHKGEVMRQEAFVIVTFGWLLAAIFGSLPFIFLGLDPVDALFETMSGFTTTGATILTESNLQGYWVLNSTATGSSLAHNIVTALFTPLANYDIPTFRINDLNTS